MYEKFNDKNKNENAHVSKEKDNNVIEKVLLVHKNVDDDESYDYDVESVPSTGW